MDFWKFSLENLITLCVLGTGGIAFLYTMRAQLSFISERMLIVEKELKRLVDVLIVQGRQEERLNAVDSRLASQGTRLDELNRRFNEKADKL